MPATLLLVDDNAIQAATRQAILKRSGYHIVVALSPDRALALLHSGELTTPIDLIITDHVMPGMNGVEFISSVRTFAPRIPVLVISGMAEAESEYATLEVQFRLKPLLPDRLIATVASLVATAPGSQQLHVAS